MSDVDPRQFSPTVVLFESSNSGYETPDRLVVRDARRWQETWQQLHGPLGAERPAPAIDFTREVVVVIALGQRGSGGHAARVEGVVEMDGEVIVRVREWAPGAGCMSTQQMTSPALAVRVPAGPRGVRVEATAEEQKC